MDKEIENYVRINLLVKDCGKDAAELFLCKVIPEIKPTDKPPDEAWDLAAFLTKEKQAIERKLNRRAKQDQTKYRLIYPSNAAASSVAEWDVQLVIWILVNYCDLDKNYSAIKSQLNNIGAIRNDVCHPNKPKIINNMYDNYVARFENACEDILDRIVDKEKYTVWARVKIYKTMTISSRNLGDIILWNQAVVDELEEIKAGVQEINEGQHTIIENQRSLMETQSEISRTQNQTRTLQEDVHEVSRITAERTLEISASHQQMRSIQEDTHEISRDTQAIALEMSSHQQQLSADHRNMREDVRDTQAVSMENNNMIRRLLNNTNILLRRSEGHVVPPETRVEVIATNNTNENLYELLQEWFEEALRKVGPCSPSRRGRLITKIREVWRKFDDYMVNGIRHECIALYIQSKSAEALLTLYEDSLSGRLTTLFHPIQDELRKEPGQERLQLVVEVKIDDMLAGLQNIVHQLENKHWSATRSQPGPVQMIKGVEKSDNGLMLSVQSSSFKAAYDFETSVRSGARNQDFRDIAFALREEFNENEIELDLRVKKSAFDSPKGIEQLLAIVREDTDKLRVKQVVVFITTFLERRLEQLLTGTECNISEQQAADWSLNCFLLFLHVGDIVSAVNVYYKGIVFNPQFDKAEHSATRTVLYPMLLRTQKRERITDMVMNMKSLAISAEQRHNWMACLCIDSDRFSIDEFMTLNIPLEDMERPKTVLRMIRCYLGLENYDLAKKLCRLALGNVFDFDNGEAFYLWSKALLGNEKYKNAFEKCEEAEKCLPSTDVWLEKAIKELKDDIKQKIEEDSKIPLTTVICEEWHPPQKDMLKPDRPNPIHTRHRRGHQSRRRQEALQTMSKIPFSDIKVDAEVHRQRTRYGSESTYESDISYGYSSQEDDESESGYATGLTATVSESDQYFNIQHFSSDGISARNSQINEQSGPDTLSDGYLLENGIELSDGCLQSFNDETLRIHNRPSFYSEISNDELKRKVEEQPKIYIRCRIVIESSHEAVCFPIQNNPTISRIEISGRSKIGKAFNNDIVVVKMFDSTEKEIRYGQVEGILEPSLKIKHPVFLCLLDETESHLVVPLCKSVPKLQVINKEVYRASHAKERRFKVEVYEYDHDQAQLRNPKVVHVNPTLNNKFVFLAAFIKWSSKNIYPHGVLIRQIPFGNSFDRGLRILKLQYRVPDDFCDETSIADAGMQNAATEHVHIGDNDIFSGRKDFTSLKTFSISSTKASWIDKAFSIQKRNDTYTVGIHIADVASIVERGGPEDQMARSRGCAFVSENKCSAQLFPDHVLRKCCFLRHTQRRSLSFMFDLTDRGTPEQKEGKSVRIEKAVISLQQTFTYDEIEEHLLSEEKEKCLIDIKTMSRLGRFIRGERLKDKSFHDRVNINGAMNTVENVETVPNASFLGEFLILVNRTITKAFQRRVDLRCFPAQMLHLADKENLERFCKSYTAYIDVVSSLQNQYILGKRRGVDDMNSSKNLNIVIPEIRWNQIEEKTTNVAMHMIQNDALFPKQHSVLHNWVELNRHPTFVCYTKDDCIVESDTYYSTVTSPTTRYVDIVAQRLYLAGQSDKGSYEADEIKTICATTNSATERSINFSRGCNSLKHAIQMKTDPHLLNVNVDKISEKSISVIFQEAKETRQKEIDLNLLDLARKPDVTCQNDMTPTLEVTWRKRLYQHGNTLGYAKHKRISNSQSEESGSSESDEDDDIDEMDLIRKKREHEICLPTHRNDVLVPLEKWKKLLRSAISESDRNFRKAFDDTRVHKQQLKQTISDVTTECDLLKDLMPSSLFSSKFTWGQTLQVQMAPTPVKGLFEANPILFKLSDNVIFCLAHTRDPVLCLEEYATNGSLDKYRTIAEYLDIWKPILLMEAANGVICNEETFVIKNVPIKAKDEKERIWQFTLPFSYCEQRNIEFAGTSSDSGIYLDDIGESRDWLCVKTEVQNKGNPYILVKHAHVVNVVHKGLSEDKSRTKKKFKSGFIEVCFKFNDRHELPRDLNTDDALFNIEVLRKSEVDRRTEGYLQKLKANTLACHIALREALPKIDMKGWKKSDIDITNDDGSRKLPSNNEKQKEAVQNAMNNSLSFIVGPPGTGKTCTGVKLIYLFDKLNSEDIPKTKQVLYCGPSNKSVDLVAKLLLNRLGKSSPKLIRVYGRTIESIEFPIPGRTFQSKRSTHSSKADPELKSVSLHHLIRKEGKPFYKDIVEWDRKFRNKLKRGKRIYPQEIRRYVNVIRNASIEEIRQHDVILCTTSVATNLKVTEARHIQQLIIDEAGMCTEPQTLVPIISTMAKQVVLIGDHKQLKPIIKCKDAAMLGLGTSLFESYCLDQESSRKPGREPVVKVPYTMLEKQYRMHPELCAFPSAQFYSGKLITEPGSWQHNRFHFWPYQDGHIIPHLLIHVEGEEKALTVTTDDGNEQSKSNTKEVDKVVETYDYMVRHAPSEHIGILSQYNAQCKEIKSKLSERGLHDGDVYTVVSSQGQEWDYVVFSTVRSLPQYKIESNPTHGWCKHNLGSITDRNQVNVALTRARKGLIIIGNKNLLVCDRLWRRLVQQYEDDGCVKMASEFPPAALSRRKIMQAAFEGHQQRFGRYN